MRNENYDEIIVQKLDKAIHLLALNLVSNMKQADQIKFLHKAGFAPKEIAALIGTTANSVRVRIAEMKKKVANR